MLDRCIEITASVSPVELAPEPVSAPHLPDLEALLGVGPVQRRRLHRKQSLFRAGQPCHSLFLIHAGIFKTCVLSEDGREKVTGFHMRGDLLGIDSFGSATFTCEAVALDTSEVWELPVALIQARGPQMLSHITAVLAHEIRRDWRWMLMLSTLNAEQRVAVFLLDLAARLETMGFSARHLLLRMTRAELGNFLALQLETVTRVLSRLAARGLIAVQGREVRIENPVALRGLLPAA